jgi:hypothetical protein
MEVKIGVTNVTRELTVDTDLSADEVEKLVRKALEEGGALSLSDARGRRVVVPVDRLGYVDLTTSTVGQVGFRS